MGAAGKAEGKEGWMTRLGQMETRTQKGRVCGECFYQCMQEFQMRVQKLVDRYEAQYQKKRDRKVCHFTATAAQWHTADMLSSLSFILCNMQYLHVFCCAIKCCHGF